MSESTPTVTKTTNKSDDLSATIAPPFASGGGSRTWIWSVAVHLVLFALLFAFMPVTEVIFDKEKRTKPEITKRDEDLARIIDKIREVQAEKIRERVAVLGQATDRMEINYLNKQGRHRGFEHAQKMAVHKRISESMNDAIAQLQAKVDAHAALGESHMSKDLFDAQYQRDILARQEHEEIVAALPLLPDFPGADTFSEVQRKTAELHGLASDFTRWFNSADNGITKHRERLQTYGEDLEKEQTELQGLQTEIQESQQKLATAEQAEEPDKGTIRGLKRDINRAENKIERVERDIEKVQARIAKSEQQLEKNTEARKKKYGELEHFAGLVLEKQQHARELFHETFKPETIIAAYRKQDSDIQEPFTLATQVEEPAAPYQELQDMDIVDLFEKSDELITQVTTDYRSIKAIELARMRDLAVEAALDQISPVAPLPTAINKKILRQDLTDPDLVSEHKAEVEKVKASVEEKIALALELLEDVESRQMDFQPVAMVEQDPEDILQEEIFDEDEELSEMEMAEMQEMTPEELAEQYEEKMEELTEFMQQMTLAAMEDEQEQAKDLAEMMNQEGEQSEQGAEPKQLLEKDTPGLLGRKLTSGGEPAEWLFVDTWYTIGPFDNQGRRNLLTKFPPETLIDLDATYVGKDGRQISWQFVQSRDKLVVPADAEEYAIYYAYTEVYSDIPRDVWISLGSDDKANVWINDMPVWISGDQLKGWNPSEGYRKVHLNAGANKILYRVENGWQGMGYSLAIHAIRE